MPRRLWKSRVEWCTNQPSWRQGERGEAKRPESLRMLPKVMILFFFFYFLFKFYFYWSIVDRGWDGWMAWLTWWTWVWVDSGSWWQTGRPGELQSVGSQSQTQLSNWTGLNWIAGLQCCASFRCTVKWISHTYSYICSFLDSFPISAVA